jgi:cytosine/uracil/thiamine/allantoin permease
MTPIFVVSTKCIDPWVLEFVVSNIIGDHQMGKLYFVGFFFFFFVGFLFYTMVKIKSTTKTTKQTTIYKAYT